MFIRHLKENFLYFLFPAIFILYLLIHTSILFCFPTGGVKYSYGVFESILLYFILIPLYVLSLKEWLTFRLFKKFLLVFCLGVFTFNIVAVFNLTGTGIFTAPEETIKYLYDSRFGGNKLIFNEFIFLEPQALYLAVCAVISCFLAVVQSVMYKRILWGILFVCFIIFLSFTVTKSAILAFLIGFLIWSFYLMKRLSFQRKCCFIISFGAMVVLLNACMPSAFNRRIDDAKQEVVCVVGGKYQGGSIAPRLALLRENLNHFSKFGWSGFGVGTRSITKVWYLESTDGLGELNDTHNSFFQYWLIGGLIGLSFILSFFIFPLYGMVRARQFSFLVLAILALFFITNNTSVLLILNDSKAFILFFLSAFYFYQNYFVQLERKENKI